MLATLIEKELKAILLSPKFTAVFAVCSILIVLSVYIGIQDYQASMAHYETTTAMVDQEMRDVTNWNSLQTRIIRRPDPMDIFVAGIKNDIGRMTPINQNGPINLFGSNYAENTIFAVFRSMDMMFIIQIVLSLFAILFTYDAINGERESGTLKLSFANAVPRARYIIAKFIGSWLGLVLPLLIPVLLGILLVLLYRIPMTSTNWLQLVMFLGVSILYFTFFISLGILLSSLTRHSSTSFLYLLVFWVGFVLIIPRAGVMLAGQVVSVPTATEISSLLSLKSREYFEEVRKVQESRWRERRPQIDALAGDNNEGKREQLIQEFQKEDSELHSEREKKVEEYDAFLNQDWRNRKAEREILGFTLSRFSPASAFQLASMEISNTGLGLKTGYEDQLRSYRSIFNLYREEKAGQSGGFYIGPRGNDTKPLDLSDLPRFRFKEPDIKKIVQATVIDIGILSIYILLTLTATFVAFNRYDVR